jgi:UDPglucose 6-dehydrogenase
MANRVVDHLKERDLFNKETKPRVAILGITFKPNTDDMREAASLVIVPELLSRGVEIAVYDPLYHKGASRLSHLQNHGITWADQVTFGENVPTTVQNADAILILTEWNAFRGMDLSVIKTLLRPKTGFLPLLIDYRNIFKPQDVDGFTYISLGRPDLNR